MRLIMAGVIVAFAGSACQQEPTMPSSAKSMYESPEIELVTDVEEAGGLVAAVGSIQAVLAASEGGESSTVPYCTGFMVSPRHLLTAAHCAKYDFVFDRSFRSKVGGSLSYAAFGNSVRLVFDGDIEETGAAALPTIPRGPLYGDTQDDFAIFALPDSMRADVWVDLEAVAEGGLPDAKGGEEFALLGFPNGVPLTRAACHRLDFFADGRAAHDCDALSGASGGLIADLATGQALALHLAGPGANDAAYWASNGRFETSDDFARRRGCGPTSEGSTELDPACVRAKGLNRAVSLRHIRQALATRAPDVWKEILSAMTSPGGEDLESF